jgi:hypothetical protein
MPLMRCLALAPFLIFACVGCGQDAHLGQVAGTVRLDGKPLSSGTVQFVPDAGRLAQGAIQADGTYALDGAQIGAHRVAIVAYEAGGDSRPAYESRAANKPLVPQKYMAVGTSELTFDVKPGDNQADFELKSR